ncbi:MAG: MCE family protein [Bacteroidia bacterium]|nr:MAG: MCE family protein [Bacteroidia bacterium]
MKRAQKIRLGIFLMVSTGILIILIVFFIAQSIFETKEQYFVAYENISVSGLEVGSPVKYLGINVGTIADIRIDPDDVHVVILELALREDTPVKEDAVADIVAMGITGLRTIEIRGGTREAAFLEPGGYIRAGTSFAEDITGKAEDIYFKLEQVLNNLQVFTHPDNMQAFTQTAQDISAFTRQAGETVTALDGLVADNRDDIRQVVASAEKFTRELDKTSEELFMAVARFNQIMQGDTLGEVLGNFRELSVTLRETNLNELIEQLAATTSDTQILLRRVGEDIDRGSEALAENLLLLQYTLENIHEVSRKASANPSILIRRPRMEDAADKILKD